MSTPSQPSQPAGLHRCAVCGREEETPLLQRCFECGADFHLNPRNDVDGIDCGDVWIGDMLGGRFYCQRCIDRMDASERRARGDLAHAELMAAGGRYSRLSAMQLVGDGENVYSPVNFWPTLIRSPSFLRKSLGVRPGAGCPSPPMTRTM